MGIKFKIPKPKLPSIPKPHIPKPSKPHIPNVSSEIRKALDPVFKEIDNLRRHVDDQIEKQVESGIHQAIDAIETEVEKSLASLDDRISEIETKVGESVADGLNSVFSELVELAESGLLKEALGKIEDIAEKEVFEGSAPIVLRTAYLDIELTDAKLLAQTIRDMINDGLPTSKREWRHIIIDLAPKALEIKPGIPLIAQLTKKIPLENLERKALDAVLRKAGL